LLSRSTHWGAASQLDAAPSVGRTSPRRPLPPSVHSLGSTPRDPLPGIHSPATPAACGHCVADEWHASSSCAVHAFTAAPCIHVHAFTLAVTNHQRVHDTFVVGLATACVALLQTMSPSLMRSARRHIRPLAEPFSGPGVRLQHPCRIARRSTEATLKRGAHFRARDARTVAALPRRTRRAVPRSLGLHVSVCPCVLPERGARGGRTCADEARPNCSLSSPGCVACAR